MNVFFVGAVIIFVLFLVILIANPKISCFGKKIKSPFYPLLRKKKKALRSKKKKIEDYGFSLVDEESRRSARITELEPRKSRRPQKSIKIDDYGFSLSDDTKKESTKETKGEKK
ncbi:MAG: hypothetical protein J7L72_04855 [Candidatus Aminicenantes bacterium]|nr:hypothetical protein [Candidatus Aminicenantes bacterium]